MTVTITVTLEDAEFDLLTSSAEIASRYDVDDAGSRAIVAKSVLTKLRDARELGPEWNASVDSPSSSLPLTSDVVGVMTMGGDIRSELAEIKDRVARLEESERRIHNLDGPLLRDKSARLRRRPKQAEKLEKEPLDVECGLRLLNPLVTIRREGEPDNVLSIADFFAENGSSFCSEDLQMMFLAWSQHEAYHGGGGAGPEWSVELYKGE